ncbi:MAG: TRAP transporter small permease [candidate division NC10 bacterium]|nr:TRAP transporter small permease [candidate division NC10 bacterium]
MWRWLNDNFEEAVCAGLLLFMATLAFVNILARYFTNFSLAFSEEIEVSLLVYLTMLGTAAGFKRGIHLGLIFLVNRLPRPVQRWLRAGSAVLACGLFLALLWFSVRQIQDEVAVATTSEALAIPQWWYTLGLPLGSILIVARIVQATRRALRRVGPS